VIIGIPKEIKDNEYRVALPPEGVAELAGAGHTVRVESGAGEGSGFSDADYAAAGAALLPIDEVFEAELILKVKEPQPGEIGRFHADQILFTYLHLAADEALTRGLMDTGVTAIAYEAVRDADGRLPLLAPMSAVAGALAVTMGAHYLERAYGGRGVLLPGIAGIDPGQVTVIGAGVVGMNATRVAVGMGARVTVLDRSLEALARLTAAYPASIARESTPEAVAQAVADADIVVGGVLIPGAQAPRMITREMIAAMRPGSVIVDVAIDQGGCVEGIRPTSHTDPVYVENGVVFCAIPNMPGVVPLTSTRALAAATLPYIRRIAADGWQAAAAADPGLRHGLRMTHRHMTHQGLADAFSLPYADPG
jgi:alanine dehydrogenase